MVHPLLFMLILLHYASFSKFNLLGVEAFIHSSFYPIYVGDSVKLSAKKSDPYILTMTKGGNIDTIRLTILVDYNIEYQLLTFWS